ncbi:MAG: 50S ribosomal protein L10 [Bacilli bacterium]|nr:50S ribosomal protein L10 [Bacilli bacterium]
MANPKILEQKQTVIDEIANKVKESTSVVLFNNAGLTVAETIELRRKLREKDSDLKIYKNTLAKRALDSLKIDLGEELNGPKAIVFGSDAVEPVKVLSDFAKAHPALEIRIGYIDGTVTDKETLSKLAATPSRDTLLTMFAAGLLEHVKNVAICLDLHSKNIEEK